MNPTSYLRAGGQWLAAGVGVAAAVYGAYVASTWYRYGDAAPPTPEEQDPLLGRFMADYEIVERHHIRVPAPAAVTLDAARDMDLQASPVVRTIIRVRESILRATPDDRPRPRGLLAEVQSLGWGCVPGREVVVGAVTKPWEANVMFRALAPDRFATFDEPGYVKIAWTIRAEPISEIESAFRTETRSIATDANARQVPPILGLPSPGIVAIRWALLGPVRKEAERRARERGYARQTAIARPDR